MPVRLPGIPCVQRTLFPRLLQAQVRQLQLTRSNSGIGQEPPSDDSGLQNLGSAVSEGIFPVDKKEFEALKERLSAPDVDVRKLIQEELDDLFSREIKGVRKEPEKTVDQDPYGLHRPYTKDELIKRRLHAANLHGQLGGEVATPGLYKPMRTARHPPKPYELTLNMLVAAGAHLGSNTTRLRPSMLPFIIGHRNGVHIIDAEQTLIYLRRAARVVSDVAERGGIILLVGTRKGHERTVILNAERMGGYHLFSRWIPGLLTNPRQALDTADREIKVKNMLDEEVKDMNPVGAVKPDLVIFFNPTERRGAIRECIQELVPTIGICDTDMEPTLLTYPIPANDDSLRTIELIGGILGRAGQEGRQRRLKYFASRKEALEKAKAEESLRRDAEAAAQAAQAVEVETAAAEIAVEDEFEDAEEVEEVEDEQLENAQREHFLDEFEEYLEAIPEDTEAEELDLKELNMLLDGVESDADQPDQSGSDGVDQKVKPEDK